MAAALTVAILVTLSVIIVRIAGVMMRMTGLPETVARFQCLSALTGTGFTTSESEMIVNYPARRRILIALMVIGHLGFVSMGSTFIVAFIGATNEEGSVLFQAMAIASAILLVLIVALYKPLDNIMCGMADKALSKTIGLGNSRYKRLYQVESSHSVSEHTVRSKTSLLMRDIKDEGPNLTILGVRRSPEREFIKLHEDLVLYVNDVVICFGLESAHKQFEDLLSEHQS